MDMVASISSNNNTPTQAAHTTSPLSSTSSPIASNVFRPSTTPPTAAVMTTTPTHPPDGYDHSKVVMTSPVASATHQLPSWVKDMSQSKILPEHLFPSSIFPSPYNNF